MAVRKIGLMLGLLTLAAMLAVMAVACGGDEGAPSLDDPDATGHELAEEFLTLLQDEDTDGLDDFLSDAFILQRADGSFATKDDYLTNLPEIREFTINAVTARQSGGALTVKWELLVDEDIEGTPYSQQAAPRLSTFVWDADRWRMTGHANFGVPATATPATAR